MAPVYNVADLPDSSDEEANPPPPDVNMVSAARFVRDLLGQAHVEYAIIGGFSLRVRGSERMTRDVDIAVMPPGGERQIREIFQSFSRVELPNHASGIVRIFVHTGPGFDHCPRPHKIQIDLLLPGTGTAPSTVIGRRATATYLQTQFNVLDSFWTLQSKLRAHANREALKDRLDIQFLLRGYRAELQPHGQLFDREGVRSFLKYIDQSNRQQWRDFFQFQDAL